MPAIDRPLSDRRYHGAAPETPRDHRDGQPSRAVYQQEMMIYQQEMMIYQQEMMIFR